MAKIGDVVEIKTPKGFAYAQVTHKKPMFGTLVRVLDGLFKSRPTRLTELIAGPHRYFTFVPIDGLCKRRLGNIIGHEQVPANAVEFPVFKTPLMLTADGKRKQWWLWDGAKEWPVGELSREQKRFPSRAVLTPEEFVHRVVIGWAPEDDC